jgi:dTDP-4-dehydrorhamnose reductase
VRLLVTGTGGLLGGRLAALLADQGFDVLALRRGAPAPRGLRALQLELTDTDALERTLEAERPDALVHAAVLGRADQCEERPREAERVNTRLPGTLARLCQGRGIRLVALSTDLVFAGDRAFVAETDPPHPLSVYGRSKLAGEEAVLAACPSAAIARVSLVLGRGHGVRGTASESVAWALRAGRPVRLFTDEYRTPIDPESVTRALGRLVTRGGAGLFHLGGPERLSRHQLGLRVASLLALPTAGVEAASQREYRGPDRRAPDVSLDSTRARRELGWEPRPLDEALREGRLTPDET